MHLQALIEGPFVALGFLAQEVLQIVVIADLVDGFFVTDLQALLDHKGAKRDSDGNGRTAVLSAKQLYIALLNLDPRAGIAQHYPSTVFLELPAKTQP